MSRHLDLMVEVFGEEHGCVMFRKVAPWYAKRFGPVSGFNKRVVHLRSRTEFQEILAEYLRWRGQFCDDQGELLPRYAPAPMIPSFMRPDPGPADHSDEPASARRTAIPVPRGPVEIW